MKGIFSMKKIIRTAVVLTLILAFAVSGTACNKAVTEDTPLRIAVDAWDGVFNPFFSTSGTDSDIVGQTQVGMLSTNEKGEIVAGNDEPCVTYDYTYVTTGSKADQATDDDYSNFYTDYYFAIKDNLKFSDGTDLTIHDVLFNLYMYLDPVYTGSATLYSVNIQGLQEYRTQSGNKVEQEYLENMIQAKSQELRNEIVAWCNSGSEKDALTEDQLDYIDRAKEYFLEELTSDWATAVSTAGDASNEYKLKYGMTEAWQIYLFMYGRISGVSVTKNQATNTYTVDYSGWDKKSASELTQDALINELYRLYVGDQLLLSSYKEAIKAFFSNDGGWATTSNMYDYMRSVASGVIFEDLKEQGELPYPNISGITVEQLTELPNGNGTTKKLDKSRDVLHIRINGVDPKAIYNFGFTVAPMHYYSTEELTKKAMADETIYTTGGRYFGVDWNNIKFMDGVREQKLPMGAGPYKANATNYEDFKGSNFISYVRNDYFMLGAPKIKYLQYKVVASNSKMGVVTSTHEVEYSDPQATDDNDSEVKKLISQGASINYATVENLGYGYIGINPKYVKDISVRRAIMISFDSSLISTYYGTDLAFPIYRPMSMQSWAYPKGVTNYFWNDNVASELGGGSYPTFKEEDAITRIKKLVRDAGYTNLGSDGVLSNSAGDRLSFTFTVAGSEEKHPARATFMKSKEILEQCGFSITVQNDPNALIKLASGRLAVWAAAWSSTIDPDMYQVYHMDSKATSTKNWGYDVIKDDTSYYAEEWEIIQKLSKKIEEARESMDNSEGGERAQIYWEALDLVMELAVEYPLYQRSNLYVWNTDVINDATLFKNVTSYAGPLSKIWSAELNVAQ